jgi:alpha-tubulin suppressor-like RCC1 family protein
LKDAKQISAGKDHSLALCGSKVYGWGNSTIGQLGLLKKKIYYSPV